MARKTVAELSEDIAALTALVGAVVQGQTSPAEESGEPASESKSPTIKNPDAPASPSQLFALSRMCAEHPKLADKAGIRKLSIGALSTKGQADAAIKKGLAAGIKLKKAN